MPVGVWDVRESEESGTMMNGIFQWWMCAEFLPKVLTLEILEKIKTTIKRRRE